NPTHEQHDGCDVEDVEDVEEGACGVDGGLEVLCQPSIAPNPCEKPLDDPAPRVNSEADLIGVLTHDLDCDQGGLGDLLSGIPAVGEDALDEREDAARSPQKRSAAVAILDARRMRFEHEATSVRVDECMALASVNLLSSIVTARPAGFGGLDTLAVYDRGRGAGVAPDSFAICHHERVVYPFKPPIVAPGGEPAVNRPPWRQVVRQHAPRAARPRDIEDAVDDLTHRPLARPACRARLRQVRRDDTPFCVGQIGLVSVDGAAMLSSSSWRPHGESKVGSRTLSESWRAPLLNLFQKLPLTTAQGTELGHRRLAPQDRSGAVRADVSRERDRSQRPLRSHRS